VHEGGAVGRVAQSMAILEWLEERFPEPALLPTAPLGRARVRMLAEHVNSSIQPLQNLAVLKWLKARSPGAEQEWPTHWIGRGLAALEDAVKAGAGRFCHGDAPGLAECYLVPQLYAARRFGVDVGPFETLLRIEQTCEGIAAFARAHPDRQPDAPARPPG
jgi:maleylpyruvate isomerase